MICQTIKLHASVKCPWQVVEREKAYAEAAHTIGILILHLELPKISMASTAHQL